LELEELTHINWNIFLPLMMLDMVLTLAALIACIRQDMTKERRVVWILVIVFINFFRPVLYFIFGRRK
jgi:heme/copper-type cytochrome/quinol oxidase subunit 4